MSNLEQIKNVKLITEFFPNFATFRINSSGTQEVLKVEIFDSVLRISRLLEELRNDNSYDLDKDNKFIALSVLLRNLDDAYYKSILKENEKRVVEKKSICIHCLRQTLNPDLAKLRTDLSKNGIHDSKQFFFSKESVRDKIMKYYEEYKYNDFYDKYITSVNKIKLCTNHAGKHKLKIVHLF